MPYVAEESRDEITPLLPTVSAVGAMSVGELNYFITSVLDRYITHNHLTYSTINELVGVLECVKLELYRRVAAPYEEHKQSRHGDVYNPRNITRTFPK